MLKQLAKKFARVIAPLVIQELINLLEDILQTDIDGDGDIANK
jgi:hypothetical protein